MKRQSPMEKAWDDFLKSYRRLQKLVKAEGSTITMAVVVKAASGKRKRNKA